MLECACALSRVSGKIWYDDSGPFDMDMIKLSVPGSLPFRDVVLRVVQSACRLVRSLAIGKQEPHRDSHDFDDKVVSAVGEAFNNVAIHAYRGRAAGPVDLELELSSDGITIRLLDFGAGFEPAKEHAPDLAQLPESHMGLYIVREFMDEVSYRRGSPPERPNVLRLSKRFTRH